MFNKARATYSALVLLNGMHSAHLVNESMIIKMDLKPLAIGNASIMFIKTILPGDVPVNGVIGAFNFLCLRLFFKQT